mmetsp:Transcript_14524/g.51079  ORF Transcript_14524/g.51079 Transcript_14524/m.51079 type:complete len:434 (-) Transcript_14524:1054-2355(-)
MIDVVVARLKIPQRSLALLVEGAQLRARSRVGRAQGLDGIRELGVGELGLGHRDIELRDLGFGALLLLGQPPQLRPHARGRSLELVLRGPAGLDRSERLRLHDGDVFQPLLQLAPHLVQPRRPRAAALLDLPDGTVELRDVGASGGELVRQLHHSRLRLLESRAAALQLAAPTADLGIQLIAGFLQRVQIRSRPRQLVPLHLHSLLHLVRLRVGGVGGARRNLALQGLQGRPALVELALGLRHLPLLGAGLLLGPRRAVLMRRQLLLQLTLLVLATLRRQLLLVRLCAQVRDACAHLLHAIPVALQLSLEEPDPLVVSLQLVPLKIEIRLRIRREAARTAVVALHSVGEATNLTFNSGKHRLCLLVIHVCAVMSSLRLLQSNPGLRDSSPRLVQVRSQIIPVDGLCRNARALQFASLPFPVRYHLFLRLQRCG